MFSYNRLESGKEAVEVTVRRHKENRGLRGHKGAG